jgi:hypothetical protein
MAFVVGPKPPKENNYVRPRAECEAECKAKDPNYLDAMDAVKNSQQDIDYAFEKHVAAAKRGDLAGTFDWLQRWAFEGKLWLHQGPERN